MSIVLVADVEVSHDMLEQVCELQAIAACVLALFPFEANIAQSGIVSYLPWCQFGCLQKRKGSDLLKSMMRCLVVTTKP